MLLSAWGHASSEPKCLTTQTLAPAWYRRKERKVAAVPPKNHAGNQETDGNYYGHTYLIRFVTCMLFVNHFWFLKGPVLQCLPWGIRIHLSLWDAASASVKFSCFNKQLFQVTIFGVLTSRFFQWETLIQLFLNVNLNKQFETVGICVSVVSS